MKQYHKLLEDILEHGEETTDRTGVGTRSIFGYQMRFDLSAGFPAVTTKRLAWRSVVGELIWFLEGSTDERRLAELTYANDRTELVGKSTIWTANADKQGKDLGYENHDLYKGLGPVYGSQWRNFDGSCLSTEMGKTKFSGYSTKFEPIQIQDDSSCQPGILTPCLRWHYHLATMRHNSESLMVNLTVC